MAEERNETNVIAPGAKGKVAVRLEVNPEDSVPFRPEPVYISLGLKNSLFKGYSGSDTAGYPAPMRIPPVDLGTDAGILKAFSILGFEPGTDTAPFGFSTPAPFRASAAFRETVELPGRNVPFPPESIPAFQQNPMLIAQGQAMAQQYLSAQAAFFQMSLAPLQAKLRECGVPFTLGGTIAPSDLRPQLFLVEHYLISSFRGDLARDGLVDNVSIWPGGSLEYKVIFRKKTSTSSELTSTVMDSQDQEAKANFNTQMKKRADSKSDRGSYSYGFDGSFHGEATVGIGEGTADAQVRARGSSDEVREQFMQAAESAMDTQVSEANHVRTQTIVTGTSTTKIDEETETGMVQSAKNPDVNPMNIGIYSVKEEFISLLSLVDVEVAFRDGDPNHNYQVSLRKLGDMLEREIEKPEDRAEVIAAIKGMLENIIDYQGEVRSIIKNDPSSPVGFSCDMRLRSNYQLVTSDGSLRRKLSVQGIPMRDKRRTLRCPNIAVQMNIEPA